MRSDFNRRFESACIASVDTFSAVHASGPRTVIRSGVIQIGGLSYWSLDFPHHRSVFRGNRRCYRPDAAALFARAVSRDAATLYDAINQRVPRLISTVTKSRSGHESSLAAAPRNIARSDSTAFSLSLPVFLFSTLSFFFLSLCFDVSLLATALKNSLRVERIRRFEERYGSRSVSGLVRTVEA